MRNIVKLLVMLVTCFTLYSCVTPAQAQIDGIYIDSRGNIDIELVIRNGIPYYYPDGRLMYYVYRNHYYRPRYIGGEIHGFYKHRYSPVHPAPRPNVIPPRTRPIQPNIRHRDTPNRRGVITPRPPQKNGSTPTRRGSNRRF